MKSASKIGSSTSYERGLHEPVHRGRDPEAPELAPLARLGDHRLPHRDRGERRRALRCSRASPEERRDIGVVGDEGRDHPVDPGGSCPLVAPHPLPRHHEERRVMDEVEQVIEPAARIIGRPLVQLGLHPRTRSPASIEVWPRRAGIHQRSPSLAVACCEHAGPLRHVDGFPALGLLRVLRPTPRPSADDGPSRRPAGCWPRGRGPRDGSHVHSRTVRRVRCPAMPLRHRHGYAAGLHRGLPTGDTNRPRSSPPARGNAVRAAIQPSIHQVRAGGSLEGRSDRWFLAYTFPSCLPDPHHPVVLVRPGVVGAASHPPQHLPGQAAPSFTGPLRRSSGGGLSPPLGSWRLVAHRVVDPDRVRRVLDPVREGSAL